MATLILTSEFKSILEQQEVKEKLIQKGFSTVEDFLAEIVKRLNQFDSELKLKEIAFHKIQGADKYVGIILDETLNKIYNICVIPPKLGTRSGFLTQQIFGFISNIILTNNSKNVTNICDKPVIVVNCLLENSLADSAICNIISAKLLGFHYIDIFNRKEDLGANYHTLMDYSSLINSYKDVTKDFVIEEGTVVFKTDRLKGLKASLTNEPYYFAINSYPALLLAYNEGYEIDISEFDAWFETTRNNKNIEAFVVYAKRLKGINYKKRINTSFQYYLTAIRTKPFLLLAGISGTGKSRIVRELAFKSCPKYLRDKDGTTPGNYCMIEVKPNWHDSTELLGYYSNLSKGYQFKKFVKFLVKAKLNPNVPFFVCLDEMNLAPVEHYFAEVLSILETRKHPKKKDSGEVDMDVIKTGAIVESQYFKGITWTDKDGALHQKAEMSDKDWYEFFFDVSTMSEDEKKQIAKYQYERTLQAKGLTLPDNVIIIGTVNMDDTTHQFSRKVIDRAMTIEMNGGKLSDMYGGSKDLEYLDEAEQEKWQKAFVQRYVTADEVLKEHSDVAAKIIEEVPEKLDNINKALKGTPFEVSYRVLNELTIMIGVMLDDPAEEGDIDSIIDKAIDRILLMKILPRIEGDADMFNLSSEFKKKNVITYDNRLEWLKELAPNIVTSEDEPHQQTAREKIQEMIERLGNQEFTRFWP